MRHDKDKIRQHTSISPSAIIFRLGLRYSQLVVYFYPMRKLYTLFLLVFGLFAQAQTTTDLGVWIDHLPYNGGFDLHYQNGLVYCGTRQGIFVYNNSDRDIQRISKVNGLSDIGLSAMAWSPSQSALLIGYENGNLDLLQGDEVINYPDIRQTANYQGLKRINHILVQGDLAYISTDFGIVTFDLKQRFFRQTFIIGQGGSVLGVRQTAIVNDSIYAATEDGLYNASIRAPLIDFASWRRDNAFGGRIDKITAFAGQLYVNVSNPPNQDSIYFGQRNNWTHFAQAQITTNRSLKAKNGFLNICTPFSAQAFTATGALAYNVTASAVGSADFVPSAAEVDPSNPDAFWIMTDATGLYLNFQQFSNQNIQPNSPRSQNAYNLYHDGIELLVAPGSIDGVWAPQSNNDGYFVLDGFSWENKRAPEPYRDILAAIAVQGSERRYFLSSYGSGLLEFRDGNFVQAYTSNNTPNMPSISNSGNHRIGDFSMDEEGNVWFTNSLTEQSVCRIDPEGNINCFSLGAVAGSSVALKDILYTSEDQIWTQPRNDGLVVADFREGGVQEVRKLTTTEGEGNLPGKSVFCFAEDLDGEIWIGTDAGVGVIYSPANIFEPNANYDASRPQIPQEDNPGFGDPLLGAESVLDIEVDGANKKWFATANSGVFYTSADGTEQIYNFTETNSPLLSNTVLDIEIDGKTGIVYFATDQGIVSFQGVATDGGRVNEDVFAYPNPVEPGYTGPILIRGLVRNAQVKIVDVEGNIVFETVAEGGQAVWSGNNFSGTRVASGVYIAYITDDLGQLTATTKILVVN